MDELLRARTPEERMLMGASMFDTARAMAVAGIRDAHPEYGEGELRRALFLRLYGQDFEPAVRDRIADRIGNLGPR
jgi:hypothetical protein